MSRKIVVVDANGERLLGDGDWPLKIGCLPGADIRVSSAAADADVALIDLLDGRPFLQSIGSARELTVNEKTVVSNRWLEDGDVISSHGTKISCAIDTDEIRFVVAAAPIDYPTLPPEIVSADDSAESGDISIAPIRSRSPVLRAGTDSKGIRRAKFIGAGALVVLLAVAAYLFTSKAVLIDVQPADAEVSIAGGFLKPKFGDRYLLRPGSYRVIAKADGYVPARDEIVVDDADNQSFSVLLEKLPGRLVVETQPVADAKISIDGEYLGSTGDGPLTIAAGEHAIDRKSVV